MKGAGAPPREIAILVALAALPLLLFLGKAVSIDAPVFIAVARQILVAPADPFGFEMMWDPTSLSAHSFNRNPPLLSYWLAPWMGLFGESDAVLHAAMLPFPVVAALAFLGIARRATADGMPPAALLVATPAFAVLATTVLLDIPTLACLLLAVYALLRGCEGNGSGWQIAAGFAAAAAGLFKYVGIASAPLLAAGALLLAPRRGPALVRVLLPPLALWAVWSAYTSNLYGASHLLGSSDVVWQRARGHLWSQLASTPVYYGCGLLFPIFAALRSAGWAKAGLGLAVAGLLLGTAVVYLVLPDGRPLRRNPLEVEELVLAVLGFAGAVFVWGTVLSPRHALADPLNRFLALWLLGFGCFSLFLNWHVNAADALLAAPPAILLFYRSAHAPGRATTGVWVALALAVSLLLARADAHQTEVYRTAAQHIVREIGAQPGARYSVGHWGFQHYLGREGFTAIGPPQFESPELETGDWVASARNVSQLDVTETLRPYVIRPVWSWESRVWLPLRTTNADAGAGFYSHRSGYAPFAFSLAPLDRVVLGRVTAVRRSGP